MDERDLIATTIKKRIASTFPQIDRPDSAVLALCCLLIADTLIDEGFSRRPELDEEELIPFLLTLRTFYNKDGDVDLTAIAKSICANFTAPEAKQREVKWPEKVDLTGFKDGYGKGSRDHIIAAAWNQAIDACKKAYEEAQPASSVNAEVVEALQALLVAVCYKTPTVDFGTQKEPNPCYEARVPVQFVHDAHKALDSIKAGKDTKCS